MHSPLHRPVWDFSTCWVIWSIRSVVQCSAKRSVGKGKGAAVGSSPPLECSEEQGLPLTLYHDAISRAHLPASHLIASRPVFSQRRFDYLNETCGLTQ